MTLFLVRPNDQTLQAEFSRSNILCQVNRRSGGGTTVLMLPIYQRGLGGSGGAGTRAARSAASRRAARTAARTRPRSCGGGTSPPAPRTSPTPPPTTPTPRAAPSSGEPGKYLDPRRKIFTYITSTSSTTADRSQLPAVRTLSAHLPALTVGVAPCGGSGLVRTSTEPQQRLSEMTLSQSTWI